MRLIPIERTPAEMELGGPNKKDKNGFSQLCVPDCLRPWKPGLSLDCLRVQDCHLHSDFSSMELILRFGLGCNSIIPSFFFIPLRIG